MGKPGRPAGVASGIRPVAARPRARTPRRPAGRGLTTLFTLTDDMPLARFLACVVVLLLSAAKTTATKPHVILVLVDGMSPLNPPTHLPTATGPALSPPLNAVPAAADLGWGNVGWHRPTPSREVLTPHMEELVAHGVELDRAYSFKFCSPSRCSLLSGRLPLHVSMSNQRAPTSNRNDTVSGFGGIPANMTTLGSLMRRAGYRTAMVGKWYDACCARATANAAMALP
jgi:hypothetical protein